MAINGLCVTLVSCSTGETIHYETTNTAAANTALSNIGLGNVAQITDPSNFPDTYYTFVAVCDFYKPDCVECTSDPNKIYDPTGILLDYWYATDYGNQCPQIQPDPIGYVLINCNATVEFTNPDEIVQSPTTALVTSTDLSLYVGMVVNIAEYPDYCYSVQGPYLSDTGCPCDVVTVTAGFADCVCCEPVLPPPPPPTCCEIPKYTQKPVNNYFLITDSDCDIKTNNKFANNYYRLYTSLRYGIQNCCAGVDMEKLWIQKEISDYSKMQFGTCVGTTPELCLYVVGQTSCGSQTATYNEFLNGKWSWTFTRTGGTEGIIYWDNVNSYWICANKNTNQTISTLPLNTDYPIGTNEEWVSVVEDTCLSVNQGLSTWTIPCELCPGPEPIPCTEPTNVVGSPGYL